MKIERINYTPPSPSAKTLAEFADEHDLTLLMYHWPYSADKFACRFDTVSVFSAGNFLNIYGYGDNEAAAMCDYAKEISGKVLSQNYDATRLINVPTLTV